MKVSCVCRAIHVGWHHTALRCLMPPLCPPCSCHPAQAASGCSRRGPGVGCWQTWLAAERHTAALLLVLCLLPPGARRERVSLAHNIHRARRFSCSNRGMCCYRKLLEPMIPGISDANATLPGSGPFPLLPELSHLDWLEELFIAHYQGRPWAAGVPVEWGLPRAFPRLKE